MIRKELINKQQRYEACNLGKNHAIDFHMLNNLEFLPLSGRLQEGTGRKLQ